MSSDYVSGASGSGMTGGSHALTQSILGAISLASENVPLGASPVSLATPYPSAPITAPTPVTALGSSSLTTWLVVIVVIVIGLFAFKKL